MTPAIVAAWLVHLYTASGFVLAFLATIAVIEGDYRSAFLYLWLQVAVDATDGWLARRAKVSERLPGFSGKTLDDLVDFLTYVFVPALAVWRGAIVPEAWATPVGSAMLLASGFGFSRVKAKTADHFFTGFPSVLEHRGPVSVRAGPAAVAQRAGAAGLLRPGVRADPLRVSVSHHACCRS